MQNQNIDKINIQQKCIVIIEKPKYMINNIFTWLKTAVKTGKINANNNDEITADTIFELKKELAKETKIRLNPFLRNDNNKKGVLIDPVSWCLDVPYYIIGDNINKVNFGERNYIADDLYTNDRIVSCNVIQEIGGNWTANISLNNTDDIYTLNNIYYFNGNFVNTNLGQYVLNQNNTCVIEPNDEVSILMSDWKGNFNMVFKGLVTSVNLQDDGLIKTVNLTCDDMLKKLTWHNYNSQASFDILESQGVTTSVFKDRYMDLPIEKLLQTLLGDTYCDIYKSDNFLAKIATAFYNYYQYIDDQNNSQIAISALSSIPDLIQAEIQKYITETFVKQAFAPEINTQNVEINTDNVEVNGKKQSGSIGYKATINWAETNARHALKTYEEYTRTILYETKLEIENNCEVAFVITGEEQPAWSWIVTNGWDFIISHYEKNSDVIARIKGITQYEFFADATGVVKYRPPNFVLPRTNALTIVTAQDQQNYDDYIINNYWVTEDLEKYFISFNTSINDSKLYTRVNVKGQWKEMAVTFPTLGDYVEAPTWYTNKYGTRFMQDTMRVGLNSKEACQAYGQLLLWKNNINYELCTTNCILNSNYTVGLPIYTERFLAVWYIGRVEHNFTAGSNCTTTLTLTYKRTPLCYKKDIQRFLAKEQEYGKLSETEVKYIKENLDLLTWGKITIAGVDVNKSATSNNISIEDYNKKFTDLDLVWQPIPVDLYPLALNLQNQVQTMNDINNNKNQTVIKLKMKKKSAKANEETNVNGIVTWQTYAEILTPEQALNKYNAIEANEKEEKQQQRADKLKATYQTVEQAVEPFAYQIGYYAATIDEMTRKYGRKLIVAPIKKIGDIIWSFQPVK